MSARLIMPPLKRLGFKAKSVKLMKKQPDKSKKMLTTLLKLMLSPACVECSKMKQPSRKSKWWWTCRLKTEDWLKLRKIEKTPGKTTNRPRTLLKLELPKLPILWLRTPQPPFLAMLITDTELNTSRDSDPSKLKKLTPTEHSKFVKPRNKSNLTNKKNSPGLLNRQLTIHTPSKTKSKWKNATTWCRRTSKLTTMPRRSQRTPAGPTCTVTLTPSPRLPRTWTPPPSGTCSTLNEKTIIYNNR